MNTMKTATPNRSPVDASIIAAPGPVQPLADLADGADVIDGVRAAGGNLPRQAGHDQELRIPPFPSFELLLQAGLAGGICRQSREPPVQIGAIPGGSVRLVGRLTDGLGWGNGG